jgi:hypothetical protein
VQGAVGIHAEAPVAREGREPVVASAQAAEVVAAGSAAAVVGDDVVGVGAAGGLSAAGVAAGAVAQPQEPLLGGGVGVAGHLGWWAEDRAPAGGCLAVLGATAGGEAGEFGERDGGEEGAVVVGERQREAPVGRRLYAEGLELGQ